MRGVLDRMLQQALQMGRTIHTERVPVDPVVIERLRSLGSCRSIRCRTDTTRSPGIVSDGAPENEAHFSVAPVLNMLRREVQQHHYNGHLLLR